MNPPKPRMPPFGMIFHGCLIAGLFFLWASVVLIPSGAVARDRTPQYGLYETYWGELLHAQRLFRDGDKDHGTDLSGLEIASAFVGMFCIFTGMMFTAGVVILPAISRRHRDLSLLAAGVFGLGCLAGSFLGIGEALHSFEWKFYELMIGYLLAALGLGMGAVGAMGTCLMAPPVKRVDLEL